MDTKDPLGEEMSAQTDAVGGGPSVPGEAPKYEDEPPTPNVVDQELNQCEQEVGGLPREIAELNRKLGKQQNPRDNRDSHSIPEPHSSPQSQRPQDHLGPPCEGPNPGKGGSAELWAELQGVLAALENSVQGRKTGAAPETACDEERQTEHLRAARESWVQVTQILEEMDREFGISYPSGLPDEERRQFQRDVLTYHQKNCDLGASLQHREEELRRSKSTLNALQEERERLKAKLLGLQHILQSKGSLSPPTSPSSSSSGVFSPCCSSPACPGSPLLLRHPERAVPALATGGNKVSSTPSSPTPGTPASPRHQLSRTSSFESETERLQRCIERLKSRNERLSAALERRKGESEQISMTLSQHEANSTALQMALRYSEECEEAYSELISLYQDRKERLQETAWAAESAKETEQPRCTDREHRSPETGESSLLPLGGTVDTNEAQHTERKEDAIRERIQRLKHDRASVCVPATEPDGEAKPSPDTDTLPGYRGQDFARPHSTKTEKAILLQELVTVREEMSELRAEIRLAEKERRCLEWTLTAQRAQEVARGLIAGSLREDLEEGQRPPKQGTPLLTANEGNPVPQNQTILREIEAALQREQVLRKRVTDLRGSLESVLLDSSLRMRQSDKLTAQLRQANSSVNGAYRCARRKYREQVWQLERQVVAMAERHSIQIGGLKGALQTLELKKAEANL
ncbi:colorectal mutant cancer protein [Amia ocellicauda]|uniref:colorectal mutant cancer protein n=1 Tax=Amia ocellicauda TaxID=2972642 RepID=UPI003464E066